MVAAVAAPVAAVVTPMPTITTEAPVEEVPLSLDPPTVEEQANLLLQFKRSLTNRAEVLNNWNKTGPHCTWSGVKCDANNNVVEL